MAGDRARRLDAHPGADRQRQDAHGVPLVHRPADVRARRQPRTGAAASSTSRRSRRWRSTSSATCARRSPASPTVPSARGDAYHAPADRDPHRRHAGGRARALPARAGRHPDHDARVALPAADVERARGAARPIDTVIIDEIHALVPTKRGAHLALSLERLEAIDRPAPHRFSASACRRRSARSTRSRASSAAPTARLAARGRRSSAQASRATTHDEFASSRAVDDETVTARHDRRRAEEAARARRSRCRSRTWRGSARPSEIPSGPAAQGPVAHVDLDGDPPAAARAHPRAPVDADLRQQPAPRRAAGRRAQRAGRRDARARRTTARSRGRSASRSRTALKAGRIRGARGDLVARARHRHGRHRSRRPDRGAAVGRERHAAHRPRRPPGRRGQRRRHLPEVPRRPRRVRRRHAGDARGRRSRRRAIRATRSTSSRSRSSRWSAMDDWAVDDLFAAVRRAAPFAELSRGSLRGRARHAVGPLSVGRVRRAAAALTWDRVDGHGHARARARSASPIANGGTIPDRGLYGVFLAGERGPGGARRRARRGDGLREPRRRDVPARRLDAGASRRSRTTACSCRRRPGEPGKMPFWKGDAAGRPAGARARDRRAGARRCGALPRGRGRRAARARARSRRAGGREPAAVPRRPGGGDRRRARRSHDRHRALPRRARRLARLRALAARRPHPRAVGDGGRRRRSASETGLDVETMWTDDGFVVRFPETDEPPDPRLLLPDSGRGRGAGRSAARRHRAVRRASSARPPPARCCCPSAGPAGARRSGSSASAPPICSPSPSRFGSFPILLETYRECLRDVFDMPALVDTLRPDRRRAHPGRRRSTRPTPSPFAASLLFGYVANYLYDGDAPLAERRAQALVDRPGAAARAARRRRAARAARRGRDGRRRAAAAAPRRRLARAQTADGVHDLLLRLGDLPPTRSPRGRGVGRPAAAIAELVASRRAIAVTVAGQTARASRSRTPAATATRSACRCRRACPRRCSSPSPSAARDLVRRYARTHGPFTHRGVRRALRAGRSHSRGAAEGACRTGRLLEGEFRPGRHGARVVRPGRAADGPPALAREAAPGGRAGRSGRARASRHALAGRSCAAAGLDALLDAIESLQGAPLPAPRSSKREILPARVERLRPGDLDALTAAGEVVWCGRRAARRSRRPGRALPHRSPRDARRPPPAVADLPERRRADRRVTSVNRRLVLRRAARGRRRRLSRARPSTRCGISCGTGSSPTTRCTRCARSRGRPSAAGAGLPGAARSAVAASRPPSAEGRWSLAEHSRGPKCPATEWSPRPLAQQLLARYGVLTREVAAAEGIAGGFSAVYDVLKALEDAGRMRRGYFVERRRRDAVRAAGGARPAALAARSARRAGRRSSCRRPIPPIRTGRCSRGRRRREATESAGAARHGPSGSLVVLVNGALAAYISRGARQMLVFLPDDEPARIVDRTRAARSRVVREVTSAAGPAGGGDQRSPAARHPLAPFLVEAGFYPSAMGLADATGARQSLPRRRRSDRGAKLGARRRHRYFRAAPDAANRALAGHEVVRFESCSAAPDARARRHPPDRARRREASSAAGKHLLMQFSGDLVLRTHMRMNGSWHIYRAGRTVARPRA